MIKIRKIIVPFSIAAAIVISIILVNHLLNKFSVENKEERIDAMRFFYGRTEMEPDDVAAELEWALARHTNWSNLFLSENFKKKFKNRKGILDETNHILDVWCYADTENRNPNVVCVCANLRDNIFSGGKYRNKSKEYIFEYVLDAAGEIDDLILLDKYYVYTDTGERIDISPQ